MEEYSRIVAEMWVTLLGAASDEKRDNATVGFKARESHVKFVH